jgi:hypothetical protein
VTHAPTPARVFYTGGTICATGQPAGRVYGSTCPCGWRTTGTRDQVTRAATQHQEVKQWP